jgi:hypothetical protein
VGHNRECFGRHLLAKQRRHHLQFASAGARLPDSAKLDIGLGFDHPVNAQQLAGKVTFAVMAAKRIPASSTPSSRSAGS